MSPAHPIAPPIAHWGLPEDGVRFEPLTGGHRARVLRSHGLAQELVFKTTDHSQEALAWLKPLQQAARRAGFVVPGLIPTRDGALVARGWTCEPFLRGRVFTRQDMGLIDEKISRFHSFAPRCSQRPGLISAHDLAGKTRADWSTFLAHHAADLPTRIAEICRAALGPVHHLPAKAIGPIHGDLGPGNLMHLEEGRIALIDWDEARRDARLFDLGPIIGFDPGGARAHLAWEVLVGWRDEPDYARDLAQRLLADPKLSDGA